MEFDNLKFVNKYLRAKVDEKTLHDILLYWNYSFLRKKKINKQFDITIPNSSQALHNEHFFKEALEINLEDLKAFYSPEFEEFNDMTTALFQNHIGLEEHSKLNRGVDAEFNF